ncbi:MFS transporter [Cohnella sp. GCM10027633]|uniref:MFS transporter n=1 Tax=unclassified Cohnella TaxID=2636738 RepID=UPI003645893F
MKRAEETTVPAGRRSLTAGLTLLLAAACGIIVANLYYAQPLIGEIGASVGMSASGSGLIVTVMQIGYAAGLLFIVPMADIVENRKLIVLLLLLAGSALAAMALSNEALPLLGASIAIGLGAVAAQVLVPLASTLVPESSRGRTVGNVMSGLLLGIMLARPIASLVADSFGWHAVYALSAALTFLLAIVLGRALPERRSSANVRYAAIVGSMWRLLRATPVLRRRAIYQACSFATFSLFWTTVTLRLTGPAYGFSQQDMALFALAGVAGAAAAPFAGRLADGGWTKPATGIALATVILSISLPLIVQGNDFEAIAILTGAAVLLDAGVSVNLVLGQRALFAMSPDIRGRLNGLFMAIFFLGGAAGSAIGSWAYATGGWNAALAAGMAFPLAAFVYYGTEFFRSRAIQAAQETASS